MDELLSQVFAVARGVWKHRWPGLLVAWVVGAIGAAVVLWVPDKYEASARIYVDTQSILKPLMTGLAVQPNVEQQVAMMGRTLINRPNIERVMRMADLDLKVKSSGERDKFVDDLMKEIEFKAVAGASNLYTIAYKNERPESAKSVVQSLLSIFVELNLGDNRKDRDQALRFIEEQIKSYEQKLLTAETSLKEFKIKNLNVMPNLQKDYISKAGESQNLVSQARLELRQAEYARDSLKKQLADEAPSFTSETSSGPDVVQRGGKPTELEERLETTRKRLDELRTRYTEEHPDVIGVKRVMAQLEEQRVTERKTEDAKPVSARTSRTTSNANPVYQQIKLSLAETEAQVAALRARVSDYEARLAQSREAALTVPKVEAEFTQLTRDYEVNKKAYDELLTRRESAVMSGVMGSSAGVAEFRVVDPPRVSQKAVWPNRPLILTLAFLTSIAAGLITCFLRDQSTPTFFDARGLRQATGVPLLGAVSHVLDATVRAKTLRKNLVFSGVTAGYLLLFTGLLVWVWLRHLTR